MTTTIYHEDCFETMKRMPDESVDMILTDPPYFLPATHYQTRKQFSRNFSDLGILEHFFRDVFKEFQRIIKPTGVIYMFCDGQSYPLFYYHLFPYCKSVRPLVWDKKTSINGYSWRHQHELIIFAEMPQAPKQPTGDGDIIRMSAVKVNEREHPAQKPVELLKQLIMKNTKENDVVYDPFAGSGSTIIATMECGRNGIGTEYGKEYYETMEKRIEKQKTNK